eukprot:gene7421-13180_t
MLLLEDESAPMETPEEPEKETVTSVTADGRVIRKRITTSEVFWKQEGTGEKESGMPDGSEEPLETKVAEPEDTKERVVQQPDGRERVVEEPKSVKPIEFTETKEDSKPDVNEREKEASVCASSRRNGTVSTSEEPDFKMPEDAKESVEEIKDRRGNVVRKSDDKASSNDNCEASL